MASLESISKTIMALVQWPRPKPTLLTITGLNALFAILAVSDCSFMISTRDDDMSYHKVGLFSRTIYDEHGSRLGCVKYTDASYFDSMFKTGRAFGILTAMLCTLAFAMVATSLLAHPKRSSLLWTMSQFICMGSTVSQMFTFFALGSHFLCSSSDCTLSGVGGLAALNTLLLAMVSIAMYVEPPPTEAWLVWWQPTNNNNKDVIDFNNREQESINLDPNVEEYLIIQQLCRKEEQGDGDDDYTQEAPPPERTYGQDGNLDNKRMEESLGVNGMRSFRLLVLSLFLFSWAVSVATVDRCSFFMLGAKGEPRSSYSGLGFFKRAVYDNGNMIGCISYPDRLKSDFDTAFMAGRIFASVATTLMTAIMVFNLLLIFFNIAKNEFWLTIRILLPCATFFQLMAFLVYKTESCTINELVDCVPGQLGIWTILNVVLMITLTCLVFSMPAPPHPLFQRYQWIEGECNNSDHTRPASIITTTSLTGHSQTASAMKQQVPKALVDPKSMRIVETTRHHHRRRQHVDDQDDPTAVASLDTTERILRIDPLPRSQSPTLQEPAELITVKVEYTVQERRVTKTITHPDGSKTITITIEELSDSDGDEGEEDDDEENYDMKELDL